jgi:hypothetical protein
MRNWLESIAGHGLLRPIVNQAFHAYAQRRTTHLASLDPVRVQEQTLLSLVRRASQTRLGRDHDFPSIRSVSQFQARVPLRTYEQLWDTYLQDHYPILEDVTWPGRIPYFALTSGTTLGATKYIPVSQAMLASNTTAARTMVAYHMVSRPDSRLFHGRLFFLGGSSALERLAPGVEEGDLSGIAARELSGLMRPYAFPPLDLALEPDWDRKLSLLAEQSRAEPITMVCGVPSWLLALFQRILDLTGKKTIAEVWPMLEVVVHGGVRFDPYREPFQAILGSSRIRLQESYPCSEGFIAFGDPNSGALRLCYDHGLFYEFVPVEELASERPTRHWLGSVQMGVNYAIVLTTCAGLWSHVVGDTIRFESLKPPLLTFTGRTKYGVSAFGEHLINEEVEAAMARAASELGASVRDWHLGPVFQGAMGHHLYIIEFVHEPEDLSRFRTALDRDLSARNADYRAHRAKRVGLPSPGLIAAQSGALEAWMRANGKLGGQHKFPRMDGSGVFTGTLATYLRETGQAARELAPG